MPGAATANRLSTKHLWCQGATSVSGERADGRVARQPAGGQKEPPGEQGGKGRHMGTLVCGDATWFGGAPAPCSQQWPGLSWAMAAQPLAVGDAIVHRR